MSSYKSIEGMDSLPTFISCNYWVTTRFEINDIRSRLSLPSHGSHNCDICQLLIVSYIIISSCLHYNFLWHMMERNIHIYICNRKKYDVRSITYSDTLNHSLYSIICFTLWKSMYTYAIFLNVSNRFTVSAASYGTRGSTADARPKRRKCLLTMAAGTCQFAWGESSAEIRKVSAFWFFPIHTYWTTTRALLRFQEIGEIN